LVARVVVVSVGTVLFFIVVVVVDVVVGVGFSTTVVHEVRAKATARSGVRMISFFIVGVVPSNTIRRRSLGQMYFRPRFSD
jgi:membrane-anchored protein YejM (alkaline phosphatase superfamily)